MHSTVWLLVLCYAVSVGSLRQDGSHEYSYNLFYCTYILRNSSKSSRAAPLTPFISYHMMADEIPILKTGDIRHLKEDLEPFIEFSANIYDYSARRICKSNEYHVDHVIDLRCFVDAYKKCNNPKPNILLLRLIANSPDNVVRVSSWIDSLKNKGAMFSSIVGTYVVMHPGMINRTLRRVKNAFGESYFSNFLEQISRIMKLNFSYELLTGTTLTVSVDMECYLRTMMVMVTVPNVEVKSIPCNGIKTLVSPSEDDISKMFFGHNANKFKATLSAEESEIFDEIHRHTRSLVKTFMEFPILKEVHKRIRVAVLDEKEFNVVYRATVETVQFEHFMKRLKI